MASIPKSLRQMQENEARYKEREHALVADMTAQGLNKYWVGSKFNTQALLSSDDIFRIGARSPQKVAMPFPEKHFEMFREMPKKAIGNPFMISNGPKLVHGTYLIGKDRGGRPVVFAFSIARDRNEKYAYKNFNIKLDMLVAGKEWLPLVRFDGLDNPHPNYIVNGKVVSDTEHVETTSSCHIHLNNSATQVLTNDLSYTTAVDAPKRISNKIQANNQSFFKSALDYTLSICGISKDMLKSDNSEYLMDFENYLFDF